MELRAIRRSCWRWFSLSTVDEHEIADVNDEPGTLPNDEHRVSFVNCVRGGDDAAAQRQIPEDQRDVALALSLGRNPLHDKARAEDELAEEAEDEPGAIECHSSSRTL